MRLLWERESAMGMSKETKVGSVRYRLHNGLWMRLSWISITDKPGGGKGGESVVPEEKLWVVKLR